MKKYYVIHDIQSGLYLKAMEKDVFSPINECGKWPTEDSAEAWVLGSNLGGSYIIILPVYI